MYIKTPTIKAENIFKKPFNHIEIPSAIQTEDLHDYYVNNSKWRVETTPQYEGRVKWSDIGESLHEKHFKNFFEKSWLEKVFDALELELPKEYFFRTSMAWHSKGVSLNGHTDGPGMDAFENFSKKLGRATQGCVVQSIYVLNTDKYPDAGMCFHENKSEGDYYDEPAKQIKCLPGSYVAYQNTTSSWHSVPEQQHDFPRILANLKTFW